MKHKCKVTVIDKKLFSELQKDYLADLESGPCPCFEVGQEYLFEREAGKDDFYHFGRELNPPFPCAEAWDAISRYIYTALAGGAIMKNWTNRAHHDRLLQRRNSSRRVQNRTHRRSGKRRGRGVSCDS